MILDKCNVKAPLLSELEINYNKIINIVDKYITGDRKEKLKLLYNDLKNRLINDPASSNKKYHNCFRGGYATHVLNVVSCSLKISEIWKQMGTKSEYTDEELVFAALNHDLGKLGDLDEPYYIPNDSEWHVKNLGMLYKANENLYFMSVPDRGLYLLNLYGISLSKNEYIAIKTHDGLYADANKEYLLNRKPSNSLTYILHQGDLMASTIEYENQNDEISNSSNDNFVKSSKSRSNKADVLFKNVKFKLK